MAKTTYNSPQEMIKKQQGLKGKTKLKFYQKTGDFLMKWISKGNVLIFSLKKILLVRTFKVLQKFCHEVLLLVKFLQTKQHVKSMITKYYDLCYTVIKTRDDYETVNDKYEND